MKYNFDAIVDRRHSGSYKWDIQDGELPMWVADMDFQTAPEIIESLRQRVEHGVFGYSIIPDEWYEAYQNWWKKRHGFEIDKEWLIFCTGVVPAISSIVRKLTTPAEKVLIQTPVYNIFFNSILNNGRVVIENELQYDGDKYSIDFEDLEKKLSDPQTTLMILCNPHNPIGKIWSKEELERIGELCDQYHVIVVSDEIHCDITMPHKDYVPFASVSEKCRNNSVTCIAASKAFNLAGLQSAAVCIPNQNIRHKVWRGLNTDEVAEPNAFAVGATIAAFEKGEDWLEELRAYVFQNKDIVKEYIDKEIKDLKVVDSDCTYLIWIDMSSLNINSEAFAHFIREKTGLYVSDGEEYGQCGKNFLRMNVACPKEYVLDGLQRLKKAVELFKKI